LSVLDCTPSFLARERCTGCYPSHSNQKYPSADRVCEHMRVSGSKKSAIFVRSSRTIRHTRTWPYCGDDNIRNCGVCPHWRLNEHRRLLAIARMPIMHINGRQTRSLSLELIASIDWLFEDLEMIEAIRRTKEFYFSWYIAFKILLSISGNF